MKKISLALIGAIVCLLTSCLSEPNYGYSISYNRVATIDTLTPTVSFKADYTGELFDNITNLKTPEELEMFELRGATRAEILVRLDVDASYKASLLMLDAKKIDILPVTNKFPTTEQMPLLGFQNFPLGGTSFTPTVWVSNGYLNVLPVVPSESSATYYFMPDKVVNDSLFFNLTATYEENPKKEYYEYIHSYDLRTLRDTGNADPELSNKMKEVLTAMKENDSVRIFVTGKFIDYDYNHLGKDTIRTISHITNYFKYDF